MPSLGAETTTSCPGRHSRFIRTRAPLGLTFSVSVLSLGIPSSSGRISTVTPFAIRFSNRPVGTAIVFPPDFLRTTLFSFMRAGSMFTDSSSPVSNGRVFARTRRDLYASAVPPMRGGPLARSGLRHQLPGGPHARALPIWASQNLDSINQTGCQAGGDCIFLAVNFVVRPSTMLIYCFQRRAPWRRRSLQRRCNQTPSLPELGLAAVATPSTSPTRFLYRTRGLPRAS